MLVNVVSNHLFTAGPACLLSAVDIDVLLCSAARKRHNTVSGFVGVVLLYVV